MENQNWFAKNQTHQGTQKDKKNKNRTVTQEGDEDAFEDNADKFDKEDSDNEQENKNKEKK